MEYHGSPVCCFVLFSNKKCGGFLWFYFHVFFYFAFVNPSVFVFCGLFSFPCVGGSEVYLTPFLATYFVRTRWCTLFAFLHQLIYSRLVEFVICHNNIKGTIGP
jgi:hypothetical protein